jgi:hypothetical protein
MGVFMVVRSAQGDSHLQQAALNPVHRLYATASVASARRKRRLLVSELFTHCEVMHLVESVSRCSVWNLFVWHGMC